MRRLPSGATIANRAAPATARSVKVVAETAADPTTSRARSIGIAHVVAMSEQLLTLLQAGMSMDRALHVTAGTLTNPRLRDVVRDIVVEIEKGSSFSDAVAHYPKVFPRLYISMIRAGERGGILPLVLERVIDYYTRSIEFRNYIITSSIYPTILLVFGLVSVLGLVTFVIPKFGEVFASMDRPLPWAAAFLLDASAALRAYWAYLLGSLVCLLLLVKLLLSQASMKYRFQQTLLNIPVFGFLLKKIQFAQICRTWGALLGAGVPILTAIRIVKGLTNWVPIEQALDDLSQRVQGGQAVSASVNENEVFPKLIGQLIKVGEESGTLDVMLARIASQYEKDVQKMTKSFVAAFEPIMIIVVGALIGFVVVSMLLAVFSINDMPM